MALQVSDKVRKYIEAIRTLSPAEAAAVILRANGGDPRAAEVDAWDLYDHVAGGTWGSRPKHLAEARTMAYEIAFHIINKTEHPQIERTPVQHPAYNLARQWGAVGAKAPASKSGLLASLTGR